MIVYLRTVATVLTVYGIETCEVSLRFYRGLVVATVLTVYGIETKLTAGKGELPVGCNSTYRLRY